jgi:hypothetical protein
MLLKNLNVNAQLFNGARGVVTNFQQIEQDLYLPVVRFASGVELLIDREDFTIESGGVVWFSSAHRPAFFASSDDPV